ncbi:MAG TPA: DUF3052 family protein, partial [Nocardioides sp.]|nr:DUF3052 family protein [Nocardioides sp.]
MRVALDAVPGDQAHLGPRFLGEAVPRRDGEPGDQGGGGHAASLALARRPLRVVSASGGLRPGRPSGLTHRSAREPPDALTERTWSLSATSGGPEGAATQTIGDRLGLKRGMVVQELGWDEDVDD